MQQGKQDEVYEKTKAEVFALLKSAIRPEFINRIDEIIMFRPLDLSEIEEIVKLQFNDIKKMLEKNQVHIDISDKAVHYIALAGFDPQFGARPVKRIIQKNLLNELSKMILSDAVTKDSNILVDVDNDKLTFKNIPH